MKSLTERARPSPLHPARAGPSAPLLGLRKRAEFLFVRGGVRAARSLLVVEARRRAPEDEGKGEIRFGLTATRKIGSAVVRNRARRRLREAGRRLLPDLGAAGTDYVLIARTGAATASSARLLDDLRSALLSVRAALAGGSRGSRRSGHPSASRQPDQSVPRDESTDA